MVIIQLNGGLGNQMFQYAIASIIAKKNKTSLYIDVGSLLASKTRDDITSRDFELTVFKNDYHFVTEKQLQLYNEWPYLKRIRRKLGLNYPKIYREQNLYFNEEVLTIPSPTYLKGYFQSFKYFNGYETYVKSLFNFEHLDLDEVNRALLMKIQKENTVAIHIRRGDYIANLAASEFHGNCDETYYLKAINDLAAKFNNIELFFFSDDIDWTIARFSELPHKKYFINHNTMENSWKDMVLMHYCNHNIIANSSFSWWAAWLNPNVDKVIISPKKWFAKTFENARIDDRIPDSWIKMD